MNPSRHLLLFPASLAAVLAAVLSTGCTAFQPEPAAAEPPPAPPPRVVFVYDSPSVDMVEAAGALVTKDRSVHRNDSGTDANPVDDPATQAFADIAGYAGFNDNMLRDELARLEGMPDNSGYRDLRIATLLWLLGQPEHAGWLDLLVTQIENDDDPRVLAFGRTIRRAVGRERSAAERNAALSSQLADTQRRIEQLSAKIDALKSLEKELLSRPEAR